MSAAIDRLLEEFRRLPEPKSMVRHMQAEWDNPQMTPTTIYKAGDVVLTPFPFA